MIILPRKYLDEIKRFPESQMSFKALVKDAMAGEYTLIATHDHSLVTALRRDLTQNIVHALELLQEEAVSVVKNKLEFCGNGKFDPFTVLSRDAFVTLRAQTIHP